MLDNTAPVPFLLCDGVAEKTGSIAYTPWSVGRAPDQDVVLTHPYVSRRHATIVHEGGRYYIADQGSLHGTFVNGQRVARHALNEGDTIHFGALDGPKMTVGAPASGSSASTIHRMLDELPTHAFVSALEKLRWFFESARKLNTHDAVDQILSVLLETTLQLTKVERGYVYLSNPQGQLELVLGRASDGAALVDDGSLSHSAIEKARRTASEYIVTDTFSEEAVARSVSIVAYNIRTVICIPLRNRRSRANSPEGQPLILGLLYLDSRITAGGLTQVDSDLLRTIATEAAALVDNAQLARAEESERRYREELSIAAEIQQGLMAVKLPDLSYAAIDARSVPCTQVGGDFYDVVVDQDSVTVVIADVSGKGISAAILASTLQGMIYSQLLSGQPLSQIAHIVNRYICFRNIKKYATLAIIRLHANGKAEYINCGHLQPLLCSTGKSTQLTESNLPVGLLPDAVFSSAVVFLKPGTRVLLATDGVTEAENAEGEFFGDDRLRASIHQCATLDEIHKSMRLFCGTAQTSDDCTMVEITYRG